MYADPEWFPGFSSHSECHKRELIAVLFLGYGCGVEGFHQLDYV